MSDIQLFRLSNGSANELTSQTARLEKHLQSIVAANMPTLLGVHFPASEYATERARKGCIDSLGQDETGCPGVIEYRRHSNENVINQGLFYLDWLLDHQAEFRWLVMDKLGKDVAEQIEWAGPRLLCIAADFTRYDDHAVQQIPRNIELLLYKLFGDDLLLELVNAQSVPDATAVKPAPADMPTEPDKPKPLAPVSTEIVKLYAHTVSFLTTLGDDVQEKRLKLYTAFPRLKNFACVIVYPNRLLVALKLDPAAVSPEDGFSRDVIRIGHWGTGDVELTLCAPADLERAKPLLERSYIEA
jgi:predicted transport protein